MKTNDPICEQAGCTETAEFAYFWPGRATELLCCPTHTLKAQEIAMVMGFRIPTRALPIVRHWWLSFADGPFLGACIVRATDFIAAVRRTHDLGINPGGQVKGLALSVGSECLNGARGTYPVDKLMSRADIDAIDEAVSFVGHDHDDEDGVTRGRRNS